jgi:hypothetical protein
MRLDSVDWLCLHQQRKAGQLRRAVVDVEAVEVFLRIRRGIAAGLVPALQVDAFSTS